jgi:(S)-2-hydroxyglutarate dehydrogenase
MRKERANVFDYLVVGGGIVGLSTARTLLERHPGAGVLVLEKEADLARHQTGHNSGVIHSGVYYRPGSLKARYAREGGAALVQFCREHAIRHEICGKVIVATKSAELPRLEDLYRRGRENGLAVEKVGPEGLEELEPHATGLAALHVPSAGIVDYGEVARAFARIIGERGVRSGPERGSRPSPRRRTACRCARQGRPSRPGRSSTARDSTATAWRLCAG